MPITLHAYVYFACFASWAFPVYGQQAVSCQEDDDSCPQAANALLVKGRRSQLANSVDEQSQCDAWKPTSVVRETCHPDLLITSEEEAFSTAYAQEKLLAAAFNSGKIHDIPGLYTDDAILVPPQMEFKQGPHDIQAVFGGLREQLTGDAKFKPFHIEYESNMIQEIGTATIGDSFTSTYYVRHVCEGDAWKIDTDILSINGHCKHVGTVSRNEDSVAMKVALEGEKKLTAAYNEKRFDEIPALYNINPTLVRPRSPRLFRGKLAIELFFKTSLQRRYPGVTGEFKPLRALEVNDVIHEIGLALFDGVPKTVYYARHAKEGGSECKLFVDIFATCMVSKCVDFPDSFPIILEKVGIDVYGETHDGQRNACIRFNTAHSSTGVAQFQRMDDNQNRGVAACIITLKHNGYSNAKLKGMSNDDQRNQCINLAHMCSGQSIPHLQGKRTLEVAQIANQAKCCGA